MSRGGRGGRGGFGRGKAAGPELPWDNDPDLKIEMKPSELFPVSAFLVRRMCVVSGSKSYRKVLRHGKSS